MQNPGLSSACSLRVVMPNNRLGISLDQGYEGLANLVEVISFRDVVCLLGISHSRVLPLPTKINHVIPPW